MPSPQSTPAALPSRSRPHRWHVQVAAVLVALCCLAFPGIASAQSGTDDVTGSGAPPADTESTPAPPTENQPVVRDITFPVVGPVNFSDTFGACRSGCTRTHKGVDIFGAKLAPLVAANSGVVVSVRRSSLTRAGNMITIRDDEGWHYIYLHLNNDTPGTDDGANPQAWIIPNRIRVGDRVNAGDVIGYLGDSGNAETTPAHLHFEIHQPKVGVINPTPSVQAAYDGGKVRAVATMASSSRGRAQHAPLISAWYRALLRREPTKMEMFAWADRFAIGLAYRDDLIADLTMAPARRNRTGTVLRAYRVVLGHRPDQESLYYWEGQYRAGLRSEAIVDGLLASPEFTAKGTLTDAQFIDLIYRNARGKAPTASTRNYWLKQFAGGRTRASMASYFAESSSVKDSTWHELQVMLAFRAAIDREPTDDELAVWRRHLDNGGLLPDVVDAIKD